MATLTAVQAGDGYPLVSGIGNTLTVVGTYTFLADPADDTILKMAKIPAGHTIIGMLLFGDDVDTGTETLEADVGITGDTARYLNSGVLTGDVITDLRPEAGIYIPIYKNLPDVLTVDTTIIVSLKSPATLNVTRARLSLRVDYQATITVDPV